MVNPTLDDVPAIPRTDPDLLASELSCLAEFLDYHRATFLLKCHGLTDEQLARHAVPPSSLSLLGLARHLTEVERGWFEHTLAGSPRPVPRYYSDASPDGDFDDLDDTEVSEVFRFYDQTVATSREIYASFDSADALARNTDSRPRRVRWVMAHLIEEYARHNGHADLLREVIDGSRGE